MLWAGDLAQSHILPVRGPHNKDHKNLGSLLGFPYCRNPFIAETLCGLQAYSRKIVPVSPLVRAWQSRIRTQKWLCGSFPN